MRSKIARLGVTAVASLALVGLVAGTSSAANGRPATTTKTAKVTVFHGVPGVTVNVYVNGKKTLAGFKAGKFAGPLTLPVGKYRIDITSAAADKMAKKKTKDIIGPVNVFVKAGKNYTLAAYLNLKGKPSLKVLDNNISAVAMGQGRVTVVHLAKAPTVSVEADGGTLIPSLSNGGFAGADVPTKTYDVAVKAGMTTVFSTMLPVTANANTIVIAYGTYPKTFAVAVQTITGLPTK